MTQETDLVIPNRTHRVEDSGALTPLGSYAQAEILGTANLIEYMVKRLNRLVKGTRLKIVSDFNGQPYGRSRPSLKGQEFVLWHVIVEDHGADQVTLWIDTPDQQYGLGQLACGLGDVEFIP